MPDGNLFPMNQAHAAVGSMSIPAYALSFFTPTFYKAMSTTIIDYVRISPVQLRELATSIPTVKYIAGFNDCQTWLLDALKKLKVYQIDEQEYLAKVGETLCSPVKAVTTTAVKAGGTIGNVGMEIVDTAGDTFGELVHLRPIKATNRLVEGVGKTGGYAVTGVGDTANCLIDGVAGVATNLVGAATGGYACEGGIWTNIKKSCDEADEGKNIVLASISATGRTTGAVVNGVARTTTGLVGGVAGTASGVLTNAAGTITGAFSAVGDTFEEIGRGDINPVAGVGLAVGRATVATAGGVVNTVGGVVTGVADTTVGLVKNVFGIFK
jgi:hypothetical protein